MFNHHCSVIRYGLHIILPVSHSVIELLIILDMNAFYWHECYRNNSRMNVSILSLSS